MKANLIATTAGVFAVMLLTAPLASAQVPPPPSADQTQPQLPPAQLDQMLAPIALYPDDLLGQVLMAAGYPLEVVEANRWLQDPANAQLKGDDLAAALDQQNWDPSVKSLVPFPRILALMDGQLDWTESLGEAFIADQSSVMDSVQRLRRQAEAAGKLRSNAQEVVIDQDGEITIEPANPRTVYVPDYEPTVVYGTWSYPDWPPYYFPDYWDNCVFDDFGYCWFGAPIIVPLWGWDHWDWRGHLINIDRDRFAGLNRGRSPIGGGGWEHDPSHRRGVPYEQPSTRDRVQGATVTPDAFHSARGYPTAPGGQAPPSAVSHVPPTFETYGRGDEVRTQAERGQASRMSVPSYQPRGGRMSRGAPSSGGRGRR
jgi:hypothetical protein